MTDASHIPSKVSQPFTESRDITIVQLTNPGSAPVINYKTAIDPATIGSKENPQEIRLIDLSQEPIPAWYSKYGTGRTGASVFHKSSICVNGHQEVTLGDGPWVHDIGPTIDVPHENEPVGLIDEWRKPVVTDLADTDIVIIPAAVSMFIPYLVSTYQSQDIFFPVSARHIVKTSDGYIHAVASYIISGLSRIVYLKSVNGGDKWTATIVDNDDGYNYVVPSITCDRNNGIHITYTRYDPNPNYDTYWLYCGSTIPDGFTLVSDSSGIGYHRLLYGSLAITYPALGLDPDTHYNHSHGGVVDGGDTTVGCMIGATSGGNTAAIAQFYCSWCHHSDGSVTMDHVSMLPVSRSLKLLRYPGIPPSLPVDIVVLFNTNVPTGFSRYSDQDGYYIFCSDDVGSIVGSAKHKHTVHYHLWGDNGACAPCYTYTNASKANHCDHFHEGDIDTTEADNSVPTFGVILGRVTSVRSTIPVGAILMTSAIPSSMTGLTSLSAVGEALNGKYLKGYASYEDLFGSTVHHHHVGVNDMFNMAPSDVYFDFWDYYTGTYVMVAYAAHGHHVYLYVYDITPGVQAIGPRMYSVDTAITLPSYAGNDVLYRYISPLGVLSSVVNISGFSSRMPSLECVCLADGFDNVHFLWSAQGLNTTGGRARICYKKRTSGTLGSRQDLTITDEHMLAPSMDIDVSGNIHASWWNSTYVSIQYLKSVAGVFNPASVEVVDDGLYVGYPSNLITDKSAHVHLAYAKWADNDLAVREVVYRKRTGAGWSSAVNLTPGMESAGYDQLPGQIYLDNKGNVFFTWSGKGYGAHTSVYHPVYRCVTSAGVIIPPVDEDPVDMFPDDDTEMIYPTVFWHSYPLIGSVYHNLVISGISCIYLYDPRNTAVKDTSDIKFYSSPGALVGDSGPVGGGGCGDGDGGSGDRSFVPSGVSGEGILQSEPFSVCQRGYIIRSHFTKNLIGDYFV